MVRLFQAIAMAALTVLLVLSLDARLTVVRADDVADCTKRSGDGKIQGCSRIIKSGRLVGKPISKKNLAIAYYNRGNAYSGKDQNDLAIADYDQAIKLNPKFAKAYGNRGSAYEKLEQRDKAIADFWNAIDLHPGDKVGTAGLKRLGVTP